MIYSSFEPSQREDSNGGKIMSIGSLDRYLSLNDFKCLLYIILRPSDPIDMILPPFESSRRDGSNEL